MQKLLRISPSGPPSLQSNTTHKFLSRLGFKFNPKFISLGFRNHWMKKFALSGSWDGELLLWDLGTGVTARRFVVHTKDVLSVAFSNDNRQIVSASRDRSIKLWNTLGKCKYTIQDGDAHTDCVSCLRFSPNTIQPTIVSASWDKTVKIWNLTNCKLRSTLAGHNGYMKIVAVSPDGSLCASGGKNGVILLWDLAKGKRLCVRVLLLQQSSSIARIFFKEYINGDIKC